jgi:hypothetical protein
MCIECLNSLNPMWARSVDVTLGHCGQSGAKFTVRMFGHHVTGHVHALSHVSCHVHLSGFFFVEFPHGVSTMFSVLVHAILCLGCDIRSCGVSTIWKVI